MKKQACTIIALLVLLGSMAVAAQAQIGGRTQQVATVPFQFNVGDKTMPAGEYTITEIDPASDHAVLQLRDRAGRNTVVIQMNNVIGKAGERARLVFNCYGSQYYFSQAWTPADSNGLQAPKSKSERRSRQDLAGMTPTAATVALRVR